MPTNAVTTNFSRVWFQEGGPGPSRARTYHGNWKAGAVTWNKGDITTIREPDPDAYNKFRRVGRFRGEPGDPEIALMARLSRERSKLLRLARGDCEHALHVHIGECQNPQDFARGWDKMLIMEGASISTYGTEDLGAMSPDETAAINEEVTFVGTDLYELKRLTFSEQTPTLVTREITAVYVCDQEQCGQCGVVSDGCQLVLALEGGVSASPGQAPTVIYTRDGGSIWAERTVSTMAANEVGSALFCAGGYTIVLSETSESLHYILTADLVTGAGTWTEVGTGFVATKGPLAVHALGASEIWIAGEGGYIYFSDDIVGGVVVRASGSPSTQDLNDIHAFDSNNIVAVGGSNAVVRSTDAGRTWALVVGPAVGIVLNTVWMKSALEWFVGAANGNLYYTIDGGATWSTKTFPGGGVGAVRDIVFVTPSVGYMAHNLAAPTARLLRTADGGYSWYVLPEGTGAIPDADFINELAVCQDPNIVYGGGLGGNAVDGFLVKAS